ncbi:Serine/threonine-protein phosphatase 7 long form [Glycine soja]
MTILRFIGGALFVDKSSNKVFVRYLQFLCDFEQCNMYALRPVMLAFLYREMRSATDYKIKSIGVFRRKLDIMKRHEFLWEPYTTNVMSVLPPICLVGSVTWCAAVPLICFHVVEWHQPDRVLRQFGMQQPIPNQWNNRAEFRVDIYPRQEGLLSFNSDYMVWYRRKTKMFVDPKNANTATLAEVVETLQYMVSPQGRNTWTVDDLVPYVEKITILSEEQERITEPVAHGLASERRFPPQEFHMLQSSVETRGFDRRREAVEAQ